MPKRFGVAKIPRNGAGTYQLPAGQPVSTGTVIDSTIFNTLTADLTTALTNSIAKNGETTPTANLPMGGFKHTGVADATLRTQYPSTGQLQDGTTVLLGAVSGVDTILGTLTPAIAAYAAGQRFAFTPAGTNTGAVTININGLGAKSIVKGGAGSALVAGDLVATSPMTILYNGTSFFLQASIIGANPSATVGTAAVNGTATTFMRSDAAPGISLSMSPTFTGNWTFAASVNTSITITNLPGTDGFVVNSLAGASKQARIRINGTDGASAATGFFFSINAFGTDGSLEIKSASSGVGLSMDVSGNVTFGASVIGTGATGGAQGAGTFNATNLFINGAPVRSIPQNSQSAAYTTVAADAGKHLYHPSADTTARVWTIDSNANVAYPIGTAITFVNDTSGGTITISITSDTLVLAGAGTTGSRTLTANGVATAIKVTSTRWIISGTNLA